MTESGERDVIGGYLDLIRDFTDGEMSASEFSSRYLEEFKNDDVPVSDDTYWILQDMFAQADAYCEPEIRDEVRGSIGEEELVDAAREVSTNLERRLAEQTAESLLQESSTGTSGGSEAERHRPLSGSRVSAPLSKGRAPPPTARTRTHI